MKKEDFTIEGSTALKKAFVEESGCDVFTSETCNTPYLTPDPLKTNTLCGCAFKGSGSHFILPDQYNEALEYVKEFWKEEDTHEDGDYVVYIKDVREMDKVLRIDSELGTIDIIDGGHFRGFLIDGPTDCRSCFRKATPEEIDQAQTKTICVSGELVVSVSRKGIYYCSNNITPFVDGICNILLSNKKGSFGGCLYKVEDITFKFPVYSSMHTKLSDWQKVWDEYQKLKL